MSALDDVRDAMRGRGPLRIAGEGTRRPFLPAGPASPVPMAALSGVIAHDVDDQVVEVWAGTSVEELQAELGRTGQCLPLAQGLPPMVSQFLGTIGGLLAMNLPHALCSQCGGPRDWTLGMTVVRTDGTVAKCGSKAVKSVAGYDVHRLFIGSRGSLGAIAKVFLRTCPVRAVPAHEASVASGGPALFVSRTPRTEFRAACEGAVGLVATDPASCTLWSSSEPPHVPGSWAVGPDGFVRRPAQPAFLEARVRHVFDPEGRLASGWQE